MLSMFLLLPIFGSNVLHQRIMIAKSLYLILVSFHYNSLIIINHVGISHCIDDVPLLLKVNFFHVGYFSGWTIFSCGACYRCISTDILPATWCCAGPGCPTACTVDCRLDRSYTSYRRLATAKRLFPVFKHIGRK